MKDINVQNERTLLIKPSINGTANVNYFNKDIAVGIFPVEVLLTF